MSTLRERMERMLCSEPDSRHVDSGEHYFTEATIRRAMRGLSGVTFTTVDDDVRVRVADLEAEYAQLRIEVAELRCAGDETSPPSALGARSAHAEKDPAHKGRGG